MYRLIFLQDINFTQYCSYSFFFEITQIPPKNFLIKNESVNITYPDNKKKCRSI